MKCYYHPDIDAVGTCKSCGKAICQSCSIDVAGRIVCQQCLASGTATGYQAPSTPTNSLALVSLICGILGLMGCACGGSIGGILFGAPAIIAGWFARKQLTEAEGGQQGQTLANVGITLGIIEFVLAIIVIVFFGSIMGISFLSELLQQ